MIKWFKNLSKEGLQRLLFLGVLALVASAFILAFSLDGESGENPPEEEIENNDKINKDNQNKPAEKEIFKSPCSLDNYLVVRKFYSLEDDASSQEISVIQFGSKYYLSRGISIKEENDNEFEVLSTMSGTVKEVNESPLYGVSIVIDHGDGIESEYISLSKSSVEVSQKVSQGQKIGVSGNNEYDALASNHLHFKISKDGKYLNPLNAFGKEKTNIE